MTVPTRTQAQQRADEVSVFRAELARLEGENVLRLGEAQREAVAAHHEALLAKLADGFDIDCNPAAGQLSLVMRVASLIGALALAASAVLAFYQFWGRLSTGFQVTTVVGAALASFLLTLWVDRHDRTGYFTKLCALVAFSCLVLNVVGIGRIFNLPASDLALLPWAVFAFLLAYTFESRLLQVVGIGCFVCFVSSRTAVLNGMHWLDFAGRPENFFPSAILLFLIPQVVDPPRFTNFGATCRVSGMLAGFLPMLVLSNSRGLSFLDLDASVVQNLYLAMGLLGSAALVWYAVRRHWPEVVNTGAAVIVMFMFTKLWDGLGKWMPSYLFFLLIGVLAVLLLAVFRRLRRRIA